MTAFHRVVAGVWAAAAIAEAITHPRHPLWHVAILITMALYFFTCSLMVRR